MIKIIWLSLILSFLGGCTANSVRLEPTVIIQNNTGRPITLVAYQECGSKERAWKPLDQPFPLAENGSLEFVLPLDCADLKASFADGKVAGTQQNIKKKFPLNWVLY